MSRLEAKSFSNPDEVRPFASNGRTELVQLESGAVGIGTFEPGWRWSEHVKPIAKTESCQVPHLAYVLDGAMKIVMDDGSELEVHAGEAVEIPPGHDAWTIGDVPCRMVDFGDIGAYAKPAD